MVAGWVRIREDGLYIVSAGEEEGSKAGVNEVEEGERREGRVDVRVLSIPVGEVINEEEKGSTNEFGEGADVVLGEEGEERDRRWMGR